MGECRLCHRRSPLVSGWLGVCGGCLRERPEEALEAVRLARRRWRLAHGLPPEPPRGPGAPCRLCVNECTIPPGGRGYCGVWANRGGRLEPLAGHGRLVGFTYLDPFVPRGSSLLFWVCLGSPLGTSTSPTRAWVPVWGHGWRLSPTAQGSHQRYTLRGSEHCSHHPVGL